MTPPFGRRLRRTLYSALAQLDPTNNLAAIYVSYICVRVGRAQGAQRRSRHAMLKSLSLSVPLRLNRPTQKKHEITSVRKWISCNDKRNPHPNPLPEGEGIGKSQTQTHDDWRRRASGKCHKQTVCIKDEADEPTGTYSWRVCVDIPRRPFLPRSSVCVWDFRAIC